MRWMPTPPSDISSPTSTSISPRVHSSTNPPSRGKVVLHREALWVTTASTITTRQIRNQTFDMGLYTPHHPSYFSSTTTSPQMFWILILMRMLMMTQAIMMDRVMIVPLKNQTFNMTDISQTSSAMRVQLNTQSKTRLMNRMAIIQTLERSSKSIHNSAGLRRRRSGRMLSFNTWLSSRNKCIMMSQIGDSRTQMNQIGDSRTIIPKYIHYPRTLSPTLVTIQHLLLPWIIQLWWIASFQYSVKVTKILSTQGQEAVMRLSLLTWLCWNLTFRARRTSMMHCQLKVFMHAHYLILSIGQFYLPPFQECPLDFLREVLAERKKVS